ncbi:MAG: indolepyruvate ferredoxin oxidoreductase [Bacteroidota bacterium]|nr:MAG: indolepyruvate ferredoxin oxidoreductase [Bacteroidota bacterium]
MDNLLLLGDEAIAQGGIDAGMSGIYAYPGTPSTEITEYVQNSHEAIQKGIHSSWSANEKTAYEAALGMSYAGKRSMVCMKHVGLNVAADAFMNSAITGVHGGMVVVVADDPGMHSSQNEQDSRFYARFAYIPALEPANQQEAYNAVHYAFDLSEQTGLPVMIRLTTRISHSRSGVIRTQNRNQNTLSPFNQSKRFILLPANARRQYNSLLEKQPGLEEISNHSSLNYLVEGDNLKMGIVAFGIAFNYVMEIRVRHQLQYPVMKIGQYPLPRTMLTKFFEKHESIMIVEEGYPVYEELLRGYFNNEKNILGRLDGTLPRTGELNPDYLAKALKIDLPPALPPSEILQPRPPMLCQGCSHRDVYEALNEAIRNDERHVFSDIGCYTLGALQPFESISTCVDMGASVTMAKGAADAGLRPAVAVIGDSTFTHSGMTGLLDAVNDQSPITVIISDNSTTGMTGGQHSSGEGKYIAICKALGVEENHIRVMNPLKVHYAENVKIFQEEFAYEGVSVIIAQRECIQTLAKKKKKAK